MGRHVEKDEANGIEFRWEYCRAAVGSAEMGHTRDEDGIGFRKIRLRKSGIKTDAMGSELVKT